MKVKPKKKGTKSKPMKYTCPHCNKKFRDNSSWHCHMNTHSAEAPYKCDICDYRCKIKKYLARHVKKAHTKPTGNQCKICGKCFHFECKLRVHMRVHTGEKPYKCEVCGKAFSSSYSLSGHKMIHTGEKPFQCSFCDYACRDNSTIRKHQERHMGISKDYPCSLCKKNFKKKETLLLHVDEVHFELDTRKFPCELCDKVFKTKGSLRMHMNTVHNKANRVTCEICGCSGSRGNIYSHMRRHIDVRPYKCSYKPCGRRFKAKADLRKHSLIHYPDKQFLCHVCDRRFPRKMRLNAHLLLHLNKNNVQCDYCGVLFSGKIHLSRHIKKEHGPSAKKYICNFCDLVFYSERRIIMHLKFGHGTKHDTICQICKRDYKSYLGLKNHYFKQHNIKYSLLPQKREDAVEIKVEPFEELVEVYESPEFLYEVDIQKQEVDADVSDRIGEWHPKRVQAILDEVPLKSESSPTYTIDLDTITYSKKVLSEDVSRSLLERDKNAPENEFDEFFIGHVMKKPEDMIERPKEIVDEKKKVRVEKCLEKLLSKVRLRRECTALEKLRRQYNKRIKTATSSGNKKEQKSIRYFKKPVENESPDPQNGADNDKEISNDDNDKDNDQVIDDEHKTNHGGKNYNTTNGKVIDNEKIVGEKINHEGIDGEKISREEIDDEKISREEIDDEKINHDEIDDKSINREEIADEKINREEIDDDKMNEEKIHDEVDDKMNDAELDDEDNDVDYKESDEDSDNIDKEMNRNGKLKFNTHQCYICFKLFKTKTELKHHCTDHFDICNDKMLKKCPFCGYVTNLQIQRHIKLVHKIFIDIPYARIKERENHSGSKYVFEINKECDLEIIPSISNLNKMASMKIDEKNRESKNVFLGKTKLIRKGNDWVVEKQPINVNNDSILPEFTDEDYKNLKSTGDTYLERLRNLSILAKKKGVKMLYPCEGCDKICLTLSALKLHCRKHEANPKAYKPKVWKNKILNGYGDKNGKNKKNKRNNNKKYATGNNTIKNNETNSHSNKINYITNNTKHGRRRRLEVVGQNKILPAQEKVENRYADPSPVKNKHKCDKELIQFYKNNIKGGDIEFWQFLKIFNKMGRENVNDFKDLENRYDFGMHLDSRVQSNEAAVSENNPQPITEPITEKIKSKPKKCIKSKKKSFTRAIMISKREYLRRIEMKNQMRRRLNESSS